MNPPERLSAARSLAWADGQTIRALELVWVERDGRTTPLGIAPDNYRWPRISPDGGRLVVVSLGIW